MADLAHIASALQFSLRDLELNRLGKVSSGQTWDSIKELLADTGMLIAATGAVLSIFFVRQARTFVKVIAAVMGTTGIVAFGSMAWTSLTAVRAHRPEFAEGTFEFIGGTRGTHVRIGPFDGVLPMGALDVLDRKVRYRVYYLPATNRFLSIEPIEPTPNAPPTDRPK